MTTQTAVHRSALDTLTLGQKEILRGKFLRQCDAYGQPWYCVDCLADLPRDLWEHWDHRCEIGSPLAALPQEHVPAEHKTRTVLMRPGYVVKVNRRGSRIHDKFAMAYCSCGWRVCWDNRELARSAARAHRAQQGSRCVSP